MNEQDIIKNTERRTAVRARLEERDDERLWAITMGAFARLPVDFAAWREPHYRLANVAETGEELLADRGML